MIPALQAQLEAWRYDAQVKAVFLDGAGPKAFCAGGDIRQLYRAMTTPGLMKDAESFFDAEYRLDHTIHAYPKPIVVWGGGIVMGGGIGLFIGASHRVVTEKSKLAMPEITIGLYPDVGTSYVLTKLPGRVGLFLGLTGVRLNAADALALGLADVGLPSAAKDDALAALASLRYTESGELNELLVGEALARLSATKAFAPGESELVKRLSEIDAFTAGSSVNEMVARARAYAGDDKWLKVAFDSLLKGSPTSAHVILEQWRRARGLPLDACFQMDRLLSRRCAAANDFKEGIRALLIDKDLQPKWSPARFEDVTAEQVESYFR